MIKGKYLLFVSFLLILQSCNLTKKKEKIADVIYTNASVHTMNDAAPIAEAVAIRGNEIVFVGSVNDSKEHINDQTEIIDLDGKLLLPGFISTHDHATAFMPFKAGLVMPNNGDPKWMLEQLKNYVAQNPDGPFYSYGGAFEGSVMITRQEIDAIISDKPFLMIGQGGHGGWANTLALELAGVVKGKPDPIDSYGREKDGTPTGEITASPGVFWIVKELNLVKKESIIEAAPDVMETLSSRGIIASNEVMTFPGTEEALFSAFSELEKQNKLTVRFIMCTAIQRPVHVHDAIENLKKYGAMYSSEFFKVNTLKIHGDGAFENRTASLLQHYPDEPDNFGFLALPQEQVTEVMLETARLGYNIHTHTIGDGATRWALNGFEAVRAAGYNDVRLTTGHTMLVNKDDKKRFAELNVCVNTLSPEARPTQAAKLALHKSLYEQMMPIGSFLNLGVKVGASADFPVFDINPFPLMYTMMMRKDLGGNETLPPEEDKVTLEQALRMYTIDAAYIMGIESYLGSIEVGKRADFVVLDTDIFKVTPEEMAETKVLKTIVDGNEVFNREQAISKLEVTRVEITNPHLNNVIDIEQLNLLVEDENVRFSVCEPDGHYHDITTEPGSKFAPIKINKAFEKLSEKGYKFIKPARAIYWEKDDMNYWIQWTVKNDAKILWAYDPQSDNAVEILQVKE